MSYKKFSVAQGAAAKVGGDGKSKADPVADKSDAKPAEAKPAKKS
jgi:hypothetical protein